MNLDSSDYCYSSRCKDINGLFWVFKGTFEDIFGWRQWSLNGILNQNTGVVTVLGWSCSQGYHLRTWPLRFFLSCPLQGPSWCEVDTRPTTKPAFQIYMSGPVLAGYWFGNNPTRFRVIIKGLKILDPLVININVKIILLVINLLRY
jgi:hypothetical protein